MLSTIVCLCASHYLFCAVVAMLVQVTTTIPELPLYLALIFGVFAMVLSLVGFSATSSKTFAGAKRSLLVG